MVNQVSLTISRQLRIDVPVHNQQIDPAIVVIVKEFCAPADQRKTYGSHLRRIRHVREGTLAIIVIERVVIVIEVCNEEIELAIMIKITESDSHASLLT